MLSLKYTMQKPNAQVILFLFVAALMPYLGISGSSRNRIKITQSGVTLISPNHQQSYYIRAPTNYIIILKFSTFNLGNQRSAFLRIADGSTRNKVSEEKFYGQKNRFKYISTTKKLHLLFHPDLSETLEGRGFSAQIYFINRRTHCNFTSLNTGVLREPSCESKIDDFATKCLVQCENPSEEYPAQCSNGIFTLGGCAEYCRIDDFQSPHATLHSCNNVNNQASRCQLRCNQHYVGGGPAVCENQRFVADSCQPSVTLVQQCEENDMLNCPYSLQEIIRFYENNEGTFDENPSEEELTEINKLPEPATEVVESSIGRSRRKFPVWICYQKYCKKRRHSRNKQYLFRCRNMDSMFEVKLCLKCRLETKCRHGVLPAYFG